MTSSTSTGYLLANMMIYLPARSYWSSYRPFNKWVLSVVQALNLNVSSAVGQSGWNCVILAWLAQWWLIIWQLVWKSLTELWSAPLSRHVLVVGLRQLLIQSAHKAWSVKLNVIHQSAALLYNADSLQVLEDEQRQAGFEWRSCCCNSSLAELHLPAQTFSAWKSNSLSRTPVCFMIGFQGQQSTKILHQIEISTVWGKMTPLHTKWWMAENQTIRWEETWSHLHRLDHLSFRAAV